MAELRFTLRALSDATTIPYRTLQDYLLGKHTIPAQALGQIAVVLDVSTDWLILGRPAILDYHCLGLAVAELEGFTAYVGNNKDKEMSLIAQAHLVGDTYTQEFKNLHSNDSSEDKNNT